MIYRIIFFLLLIVVTKATLTAQEENNSFFLDDRFIVTSTPSQSFQTVKYGYTLIEMPWRYHPDIVTESFSNYSNVDFDDSSWEIIDSSLPRFKDLPKSGWNGIGWFRLHLLVDSSLLNQPLALNMIHLGASEVYLDGKLLYQFGNVGHSKDEEQGLHPIALSPEIITFTKRHHVITVHYSGFNTLDSRPLVLENFGFSLAIGNLKFVNQSVRNNAKLFSSIHALVIAIPLTFAILHLILFLFSHRKRTYFYFALFAGFLSLYSFLDQVQVMTNSDQIILYMWLAIPYMLFLPITGLRFLYSLFYHKIPKQFWVFLIITMIFSIFSLFSITTRGLWGFLGISVVISLIVFIIEMFRVVIGAIVRKHQGAWIIGTGFAAFGFSWIIPIVIALLDINYSYIFEYWNTLFGIGGILLSMSLFLSRGIAQTNSDLIAQTKKSMELEVENARKEVELQKAEELKNAYLALEQAHVNLKTTQAQLIQSAKMASLGELTAGIAHEIQNPLNFVKNFSEVNSELIAEMQQEIDRGNLDAVKSIAKSITVNEQKIVFHGNRADAIVKGMLQHSRNSTGIKEPTDINALADEYLRLAYHGLRAKNQSFNATMHTDFDTSIGKIDMFPQDIGRVMLNLMTNAFYSVTEKHKEMSNGYEPTVSISTRKLNSTSGHPGTRGPIVEIKVKDNGKGIEQSIVDKIFQPFFTTKPAGQGTGLGLSLSYDIIKAHGGELKVETKEGEYAEFTILLHD